MPICNNPSMTTSNKSSVVVDDHASEAAKMKRTREQAYFNSYDFDAIDVLPYDDDDDGKLATQSVASKHAASVSRGLHAVQKGLIGKYRGLGSVSTRQSQRQRRRFKSASLSSKSSSNEASSSSSTRSSSISGSQSILPNDYPYSHSRDDSTIVLDAENQAKSLEVNSLNQMEKGNFSLPRAMLKYQSINDTLTVVSMPSVVKTKIISPPASVHGTMNNKMIGKKNNNNNNSNFILMPLNSSIGSSSSGIGSGSQAHILHMDDGQMMTGLPSAVRSKKLTSTSSTLDDSCPQTAIVVEPSNKSATKITTTTTTIPKTASTCMQKMKRAGSSGGSSAESEKAASWQQSHYSTNKSGSSGYYSSNVCSTYSLEDHIYCEPVVNGGVLDINKQTKSKSEQLTRQIRNRANVEQVAATNAIAGIGIDSELLNSKQLMTNNSRRLDDVKDASKLDTSNVDDSNKIISTGGMSFNEHLRILETSIENLDRHLRNIPSLSSQEHIVAFVQTHATGFAHQDVNEKKHLPTIMEGPTSQPRSWPDDIADDSLMDIDLDSFLLSNDKSQRVLKNINPTTANVRDNAGIVNPSFLSDEQEENHYKCAKYINSCPDDAYRVESDIVTASEASDTRDAFLKRYENQVHFESTRDLLEDVRDKIRLLSQSSSNSVESMLPSVDMLADEEERDDGSVMPKELEVMIKALKRELESYLQRMNQHSEREIRQLCTGLVKNQKVVRMTKAFERRRSEYDISGGFNNGVFTPASGVPLDIRQQITSIRCASDPNFKMKRKSLADVFPAMADTCYTDSQQQQQKQQLQQNESQLQWHKTTNEPQKRTQLQKNLSFHQPMLLNHINSKANISNLRNVNNSTITTTTDLRSSSANDNVGVANSTAGGTNVGGVGVGNSGSGDHAGDKKSILEWHRKKPSIWEMYYGTNRLNQSLLADHRNARQQLAAASNSQPTTMSYPSSRPESDFTLDLPRAEQLRIKMEKEKKFRQRCRYITAFLSLMFFLLTVMVVSMILTRGKRMFGSMI